MFCDLHTHSTFSDGTFSPTEIVLKAKEIGLDAVALCDHNTVAGLDEFVSAGKKYGVTTVSGIEFSTEYNSKQLAHCRSVYQERKLFRHNRNYG